MDIEGVGPAHPLKRATEEFRVELNREKMYNFFEENRKLFRHSVGATVDPQSGEKLYFNMSNTESPGNRQSMPTHDLEPIRALCAQVRDLWDQNYALKQIEAVMVKIRQWAGQDENVPIYVLFEEEMIPKLVDLLSHGYDNCPVLQSEALWILINVLSGSTQEMIQVLLELGLPEAMLRMFHHIKNLKHSQVGENLLWCFCNFLQSERKLIQYFLDERILDVLFMLAESLPEKSDSGYNITSTLIWAVYTVSALLHQNPPLFSQKVCMIVQMLITRNNYSTDQKALIKILQEFSRDRSLCQDLFSDEISHKLVAEMFNTDQTLAIPATITVCNCLSHEDVPEMQFIKAGLLDMIIKLHQHQRLREYRNLRQYITLMLGNLLCSSREIFKAASRPELLRICLELLKDEQDSGILFNLLEYFRVYYLVADNSSLLEFSYANTNVISIILGVTGLEKLPKVNITCLIIINKILGLGEMTGTDDFRDQIQETEASEQLERLQEHPDKIVYNFAAKIIEKYFAYDTYTGLQN